MSTQKTFDLMGAAYSKHEVYRDRLSAKLAKALGDDTAFFMYQPSDGFVAVFDDGYNARINANDLDAMMKMTTDDARAYIMERAV